jgi:flavin-dependent dehydrogenase
LFKFHYSLVNKNDELIVSLLVIEYYDVLIAGGSVAGLTTARECSSNGTSTIVIEEDHEIGTPEHCGGMVSLVGLQKLGLILHSNNFQNAVSTARISSKSASFEISAEKQNVIVVDRRCLDKQIAKQAEDAGAEIDRQIANIAAGIIDVAVEHEVGAGADLDAGLVEEQQGRAALFAGVDDLVAVHRLAVEQLPLVLIEAP